MSLYGIIVDKSKATITTETSGMPPEEVIWMRKEKEESSRGKNEKRNSKVPNLIAKISSPPFEGGEGTQTQSTKDSHYSKKETLKFLNEYEPSLSGLEKDLIEDLKRMRRSERKYAFLTFFLTVSLSLGIFLGVISLIYILIMAIGI